MYEKIVNYFEKNLCIENIYFREKYIFWIIGIIITLISELAINYFISILVENLLMKILIILLIDFIITGVSLVLIYILPINKIYKEKIKGETVLDIIGLLMKEERLSIYREIEIEEMDDFLKNGCNIKKTESIDMILNLINEDIKDKYEKKNFIEKYFNNTILPLIILVLTVYFTNNNEKQLINILSTTIISIIGIIIAGKFVLKIKNINITPVDKKQNLLELKRVLIDIQIKWNK